MMTRFTPPTEFRPGWDKRVRRYLVLARAVLGFERVWPALWPASGIAGLTVVAGLCGAFEPLPWPLHALILACLTTAIALTLYFSLEHLRLPQWEDAARRLEQDSALSHRPISEAGDALSAGVGDGLAEALWQAHLRARLNGLTRLRLKLPRSTLAARDPKGLRFGVLLLIAIGFFIAGSDWSRRLESIFTPNPGVLATLDAWIEPPAYTGQSPLYLGHDGRVAVPAGSILNMRVHGADHRPSATLDDVRFEGEKGEYAGTSTLRQSGRVRVRAGGHTIGSWAVTVIPDKPPSIAFAGAPQTTERQSVKLSYSAGDDYGVTAARAIIRPHNRPGAPLIVDLQVPERSIKPVTLTSFHDLTEHPYAGLVVDITLEAVDAAGNKTTSATLTYRLPQRSFTDPLARALIEQRQDLATHGVATRTRTAKTLDALTYAPELFYEGKLSTYLALRAAFRSAQGARTPDDFKRLEDLLWQTAVSLEQGGLLTMAEQLRRLQAALMQMMAQGAPQENIDALLKRYNELMQKYLSALAQNAPDTNAQNAPGPDAKVLGADDLAALMKAIEALSQSGDRVKAMQLLAMLQSLLENAQVAGGGNGSGSGGGDQATNDALRGLGDVMGRQRMLLDKSFRQGGGAGDPKDGGAKGLSDSQNQLRRDLETLRGKLGKKAPETLGKAGKLMDDAARALGNSDFPRATAAQKQVLEELGKAAEAVAKAAGQGKGQGQAAGQDPLGRGAGNQGRGGSDVKIPDASVMQQARDILLELRKRAGQQGRPKEELDYIDRLLKQF